MIGKTHSAWEQEVAEHLPDCNCGTGEKVKFICTDEACPSYRSQTLHCIGCAEEKHSHKPTSIKNLGEVMRRKWDALMAQAT